MDEFMIILLLPQIVTGSAWLLSELTSRVLKTRLSNKNQ